MTVMMSQFAMTSSEPEPKCAKHLASLLLMTTVFWARNHYSALQKEVVDREL